MKGLETLGVLAVAMSAASVLTSCGSSTSSGSAGSSSGSPPPQTTHVAVADTGDNRILIYDAPLTATSSPITVIGQGSFTEGQANDGATTPSATTLYSPHGIAVDAAGNLWVTDRGNCRVLEFKAPFSTGMSASVSIGQPDFVSGGSDGVWGCPYASSLTASNMESPVAIAFDQSGDLWVSDEAAGRITEYAPPFSTGMSASLVIGQPDMEAAAPCDGADFGNHSPLVAPTASTLCHPESIAFDSHGNLWVGDQSNMRVLEFVQPFTTGMGASVVLGQPNANVFTGNAVCQASATVICGVDGIAFDASGHLWISDSASNRITEFIPPFLTGMAASSVIGQPDFTTSGESSSDALFDPTGIAIDSNGNLIVTDMRSEVLVYRSPLSSSMSPTVVLSSGLGSCPPPGPTANTLCEPQSILAY